MMFGAGLCLLYEWTGSLYPAIALHALNNSIALGANLKWDWQIPAMMVGSTAAALLCAWLLARILGDRPRPPAAGAPAPGST
jgi:membrane protease YdiL (CAAX protease family)